MQRVTPPHERGRPRRPGGLAMSERMSQRRRAASSPDKPAERSEDVHMSEFTSESMSQRLREAPAERSEGVR